MSKKYLLYISIYMLAFHHCNHRDGYLKSHHYQETPFHVVIEKDEKVGNQE